MNYPGKTPRDVGWVTSRLVPSGQRRDKLVVNHPLEAASSVGRFARLERVWAGLDGGSPELLNSKGSGPTMAVSR
eukprot:2752867-Pleurochrysis_carterae.AAC.1